MGKTRYRKQFMFQLDLNKADEHEIGHQVEELKRERRFSKTIRDGIRLICDLRKGRLDVLHELFPWVLEHSTQAESASTEKILQDHLKQLESMMLKQGAVPIEMPRTPQPIDDIALEIVQSKADENNKSNWNLMIASALQVIGSCKGLPSEVIEYGLRTGRIPPEMAPSKPLKAGNAKPLAGGNITLSAPDFDDLDEFGFN